MPPADSLRAVLDTVFAGRDYRWTEPPRPLQLLAQWWDGVQHWLTRFQLENPTLFQWFFAGMIVLLIAIFTHASWIMARTVREASKPRDEGPGPAGPERHDASWHRREAERLARGGRYPEALQILFVALTLELDARRILRFHPSKTPNEYAVEARLPAPERDRFRQLVRTLYRYAFARAPCGPGDYSAWRQLAAGEWHAAAD